MLSADGKHAAALRAFEKAESARFLGDGNVHRGLTRLFICELDVQRHRFQMLPPSLNRVLQTTRCPTTANNNSSQPDVQSGEESSYRCSRRRPTTSRFDKTSFTDEAVDKSLVIPE